MHNPNPHQTQSKSSTYWIYAAPTISFVQPIIDLCPLCCSVTLCLRPIGRHPRCANCDGDDDGGCCCCWLRSCGSMGCLAVCLSVESTATKVEEALEKLELRSFSVHHFYGVFIAWSQWSSPSLSLSLSLTLWASISVDCAKVQAQQNGQRRRRQNPFWEGDLWDCANVKSSCAPLLFSQGRRGSKGWRSCLLPALLPAKLNSMLILL